MGIIVVCTTIANLLIEYPAILGIPVLPAELDVNISYPSLRSRHFL